MISLDHILPGTSNLRYVFAARQVEGVQGETQNVALGANLLRDPAEPKFHA